MGFIGPRADACAFTVHQTVGARDHIELAVDAVVELIASVLVFVVEVTVQTRTMDGGLRILCEIKNNN